MRFDYRGMGDSTGGPSSFDDVAADIAAAIDTMQASCPSLRHVVLCGLCDAASASLIYWQVTRDSRVAGMVPAEPVGPIRSEPGPGAHQALLRQAAFGKGILDEARAGTRRRRPRNPRSHREFPRGSRVHDGGKARRRFIFQDRMAAGLRTFDGPVLLVLSGRDLTAKEFVTMARPIHSGRVCSPVPTFTGTT